MTTKMNALMNTTADRDIAVTTTTPGSRLEMVFRHKGYLCVIKRRITTDREYLCGYVAIPSDHPLYGLHYDDVPSASRLANGVRVHGGLNFDGPGERFSPVLMPYHWFYGFDCGYIDDTLETCSREYVVNECCILANQLDSMKNMSIFKLFRHESFLCRMSRYLRYMRRMWLGISDHETVAFA